MFHTDGRVADDLVRRASDLVGRVLQTYPGRAVLSCSFGGPSGMVLLDLVQRVDPLVPVFVIDTGLLFSETTELVERIERRYGIAVERVRPAASVAEQAEREGDALWARDPDRCCALRKVEPLQTVLSAYDVWFTAIRRSQTANRAAGAPIAYDARSEIVKAAPLLEWSDDDVWRYVDMHELPTNALHAEGYPSLGCMPCSARVRAGDDPRAGRWPGSTKTECGLHV